MGVLALGLDKMASTGKSGKLIDTLTVKTDNGAETA